MPHLRALLLALLLAGCAGLRAPEGSSEGDDDPPPSGEGSSPTTSPPTDRDGACPRFALERAAESTRVGEAARLVVRIDNCAEEPLVAEGEACGAATPGLTVSVGTPEGPRALLFPSAQPAPADGAWTGCAEGAGVASIAPGDVVTHEYLWDGRIEPYCPDRTEHDETCEGAREAQPGVYEVSASFSWGTQASSALTTLVLVDETTPRVPLVLVNVTYEKSRVGAELPARGEGCPDFTIARDPWSATSLRAGGPAPRAVVVRAFPQGGYGNFGPEALSLPANGSVSITSVFDPGRVLGVIEDGPGGLVMAGTPLSEGARLTSAYDVQWEGETYHVTETIDARIEGEAYVFELDVPYGC